MGVSESLLCALPFSQFLCLLIISGFTHYCNMTSPAVDWVFNTWHSTACITLNPLPTSIHFPVFKPPHHGVLACCISHVKAMTQAYMWQNGVVMGLSRTIFLLLAVAGWCPELRHSFKHNLGLNEDVSACWARGRDGPAVQMKIKNIRTYDVNIACHLEACQLITSTSCYDKCVLTSIL